MFNYLINSIKRKIARRVTQKYPTKIDRFQIEGLGEVKFANWQNPLVVPKILSNSTVNFYKKFLSEGDLAIDIGANIGHMTVQLALQTGKTGLTLAFDPNPFVFEVLQENSRLNPDLVKFEAHNCAITEQDGDFFYNSSEASFNNGGISERQTGKHGAYTLPTKIKGVVLEKFLEENYPQRIGKLKLVKIDTEGYDKEIIKSISGLLRRFRPVVITECFGKNSDAEKFEQFDLLQSLGYDLFYFSEFSDSAEIVRLARREDMLRWGHFDLFAQPAN